MVTSVLDVMCAMGVVGAALVTGMADVAHGGGRPGSPVRADRRTPGSPGRPPWRRTARPGPGPGGCAGTQGRGDGA
ncbi:hypothetical protein [Streptomyces sp. NPDC048637]|uniref:hypothetical protein n=1 Tax=Streptomyces sp. NPDC048637 TaxID=3155636 RepID=UPI00342788AA